MSEHPIELELRAELSATQKIELLKQLSEIGNLTSETKRLSVMFFGEIKNKKLDIRVRVTNGECEIVSKAGEYGSHNRTEVSQKIQPAQFVGMVKLLSQFGFQTKVGERETVNYSLPNNITASVVSAKHISYLELEKISTQADEHKNHDELKTLADKLEVSLISSEDEFEALCQRLNQVDDWEFHYLETDYQKLETILQNYFN